MPFTPTKFPDVFVFEPSVFQDDRGFFFESYSLRLFQANQLPNVFVQDNQSFSSYGVIRGLHYQLGEHAQTKLVRVISGKILDVVVDIRKGSPMYGQWLSIELSAENRKQLFVPKGFAHGFSVLSDTAELSYKCDQFYNKASEGGIIYNDPALQVEWQIPADKALVSGKDIQLPGLSACLNDFVYKSPA